MVYKEKPSSQAGEEGAAGKAATPSSSSSYITRIMWFFAAAFAAFAVAQNSSMPSATTTIFDYGVPTDAPVPGDYTGALRPQIHFSPPTDFMNDPNGCFRDANGTWHLYYQCMFKLTIPPCILTLYQTIPLPL